jgi:hypothetical protein
MLRMKTAQAVKPTQLKSILVCPKCGDDLAPEILNIGGKGDPIYAEVCGLTPCNCGSMTPYETDINSLDECFV